MKIFFITIALIAAHARAIENCQGPTTKQIEQCTKSNYQESDADLNAEYTKIISSLDDRSRVELRNAQRAWIKYKEKYCQAAFDAVNPGEEAGIDKFTCLMHVTTARTNELRYTESKTGMESFFNATQANKTSFTVVNTMAFNKALKDTSGADDPDWVSYLNASCNFSIKKTGETEDFCKARQNYYKNW